MNGLIQIEFGSLPRRTLQEGRGSETRVRNGGNHGTDDSPKCRSLWWDSGGMCSLHSSINNIVHLSIVDQVVMADELASRKHTRVLFVIISTLAPRGLWNCGIWQPRSIPRILRRFRCRGILETRKPFASISWARSVKVFWQ